MYGKKRKKDKKKSQQILWAHPAIHVQSLKELYYFLCPIIFNPLLMSMATVVMENFGLAVATVIFISLRSNLDARDRYTHQGKIPSQWKVSMAIHNVMSRL